MAAGEALKRRQCRNFVRAKLNYSSMSTDSIIRLGVAILHSATLPVCDCVCSLIIGVMFISVDYWENMCLCGAERGSVVLSTVVV